MGRYTDWSNVTGRYGSAATKGDSNDLGNYYVQGAEAELDAALAKRYTLPFTPTPPLLTDLATDMAYYRMIWMDKERGPLLKEFIDSRLKGLIDGTLILTNSAGTTLGGTDTAWSENTYHTSFGPDSAVNWSVDSAWIEAVEDARG